MALDHGIRGGGVSPGQPVTAWRGTGTLAEGPSSWQRGAGAGSLGGVSARQLPRSAAASRAAAAHRPRQLLSPRQLRSAPGPRAAFAGGVAARALQRGAGVGEARGAGSGAGISHRDSRAQRSAGAPGCAPRGARGARWPGRCPRLSQG